MLQPLDISVYRNPGNTISISEMKKLVVTAFPIAMTPTKLISWVRRSYDIIRDWLYRITISNTRTPNSRIKWDKV